MMSAGDYPEARRNAIWCVRLISKYDNSSSEWNTLWFAMWQHIGARGGVDVTLD